MGQLVDGVWTKGSISSNDESGSFKRLDSVFRHNISDDNDKYIPETNRYHLYVSYACPWAHRTLIFRKLKKLENHISVDYIHPDMLDMGWSNPYQAYLGEYSQLRYGSLVFLIYER